jgi:hypothetical protein
MGIFGLNRVRLNGNEIFKKSRLIQKNGMEIGKILIPLMLGVHYIVLLRGSVTRKLIEISPNFLEKVAKKMYNKA